jgi:hypothetical protein
MPASFPDFSRANFRLPSDTKSGCKSLPVLVTDVSAAPLRLPNLLQSTMMDEGKILISVEGYIEPCQKVMNGKNILSAGMLEL